MEDIENRYGFIWDPALEFNVLEKSFLYILSLCLLFGWLNVVFSIAIWPFCPEMVPLLLAILCCLLTMIDFTSKGLAKNKFWSLFFRLKWDLCRCSGCGCTCFMCLANGTLYTKCGPACCRTKPWMKSCGHRLCCVTNELKKIRDSSEMKTANAKATMIVVLRPTECRCKTTVITFHVPNQEPFSKDFCCNCGKSSLKVDCKLSQPKLKKKHKSKPKRKPKK
jgi:hypothetical protein